ncbi:unnamed protein product [Thelazia callipaeda]|uniref:COP9 signalosome complex subunit 6 n=1 Tax=Thelazia callipaeda TaxID=103827 RepID=A0A0N5D819_THECL|nr:unnamed protein product [Thelazia callipaeda]
MIGDSVIAEDVDKSVTKREQNSAVMVTLHPLVIMNISEHATRVKAQNNDSKCCEVYGAILGKQSGRHVEMKNSFEVKWSDEGKGYAVIDTVFLSLRERQYQEIFKELDFVGWYTVGGAAPTQADWEVHNQFAAVHESPILVKLDPNVQTRNKLPIEIYESVHAPEVSTNDAGSASWNPVSWLLASERAERIGIEHVAQMSTLSTNNVSSINTLIMNHVGAINMLQSRLELIYDYLMAIRSGELARDEEIIQKIVQLLRRIPMMNSDKFWEQYTKQSLEVRMTSLVTALTKTCGTLSDLITKMNVMSMEKQNWWIPSGRRGRTFLGV